MAASSVWLWNVKEEQQSALCPSEQEEWFNASDNVAVEVVVDEAKQSRAEAASRLLQDLDQWIKEEEPFPQWLEEKMDLPIFDDLLPLPVAMNSQDMVVPLKPVAPLIPPTLLSTSTGTLGSLDTASVKQPAIVPVHSLKTNVPVNITSPTKSTPVVNRVEVVAMKQLQSKNLLPLNSVQYEPPLSPSIPSVLLSEQTPQTVLMEEFDYAFNGQDTLTPPESPKETVPQLEDLQMLTMLQEMQPHELDELVRMRVESLVEYPEVSVESSCSSSQEESESVASPSSSDSSCSDPDWNTAAAFEIKTPRRKRAAKPYSRTPPEEKRQRKKEQNKNAATRYRMKKKQEFEEILGEEKHLQEKNEDMKAELTEIQREIKYLKNLMRDMFKAKGLIK